MAPPLKYSTLSAITKISPLLGRYQESNGCQKIHRTILKMNLSTYCANNEPKLKELWNWKTTKNHHLFIWDKCWCLLLYPKQFGQAQNCFRHIKGQVKSLTRSVPTNDSTFSTFLSPFAGFFWLNFVFSIFSQSSQKRNWRIKKALQFCKTLIIEW